MKLPLALIMLIWGALLWSASGCTRPTEPPDKPEDTVVCDTCRPDTVICDTCITDTTDTSVVTPKDSTSHNFLWTELTVSGESKLTGCWVFGSRDMYVMGHSIHHWNGTTFSLPDLRREDGVTLQGRQVFADDKLFAFTKEDFWTFGATGAYHFKPHPYDNYLEGIDYRLSKYGASILNAAWGTSSHDMFIVGNYGTIMQFNGETWTKMESGTSRHLRAVWGTNSKNVWASGWSSSDAESILLHYDGVSWQKVDLSQVGAISAGNHSLITVWATDSAGLTHTVAAGSLVWRKTGNSKWRQDSVGIGNRTSDGGFLPLSVTGNSAIDLIVAGTHGFASHWNGKSWHVFKELHEPGNTFYSALAMSMKDNVICFAGQRPGRSFVQIGTRK